MKESVIEMSARPHSIMNDALYLIDAVMCPPHARRYKRLRQFRRAARSIR
jgi:hypothetical protein